LHHSIHNNKGVMLRLPQRHIRLSLVPRVSKQFSTLRTSHQILPRRPLLPSRQFAFPRRPYAVEAKPSKPTNSLSPTLPSSSSAAVEETKLPVTQRLKVLFKKYRWPALTVYLGLGALDFGVAFAAVRAFGTERIGRYEKIILEKVEEKTGWKWKGTPKEHLESKAENASIWTEIALAYTIHKTLFALVRVPLTVAITPSLVKWFARKGYGALLAQVPAIGRLFQNSAPAVAAKK